MGGGACSHAHLKPAAAAGAPRPIMGERAEEAAVLRVREAPMLAAPLGARVPPAALVAPGGRQGHRVDGCHRPISTTHVPNLLNSQHTHTQMHAHPSY